MFLGKLLIIFIYIIIIIISDDDAVFCAAPGLEPPIVTITDQGAVRGIYLKMFRIHKISAYLGIPYAQPPINDRRFAPPVVENLPFWDETRNATELLSDCWSDTRKPIKLHDEIFLKLIGVSRKKNMSQYDEDCLFLNIYTPIDTPPPDGYAVIVWLHSGDFSSGSPSELNPFQLVFKQKIIIVTVAYRLNIFGFFTSMDGEAPGNFGLMDQSAALLWINRNIKLFGGNENAVTLMGHGSGAISATLHLTSGEWSEQLFNKTIIMSGNSMGMGAVREPSDYASALDRVATTFGCFRRPTSDLLGCLRRVEALSLMIRNPIFDWGPIIDEGLSNTTTPFIPNDPRFLIERNAVRKTPTLIGFTDMEDVLDVSTGELMDEGITNEMYDTYIGDIIVSELAQFESNDSCGGNNQAVLDALNFVYKPYPPVEDPLLLRRKFIQFNTERNFVAPTMLLANHLSKFADTYVYRFDSKPNTAIALDGVPMWSGVPHNFDLIFVWGLPYWVTLENQTQWDTNDKRLSEIIMTMWANFAKFSNPTQYGVYINWIKFTEKSQDVLIIDRSFQMSNTSTLNYQAVQFWNDYYPKVVTFAIQCCNSTNAGNSMFTVTIFSMKPISYSFYLIILFIYLNS